MFQNFAFDAVIDQGNLDNHTRMMAIISTLLGCQGIEEFTAMLPVAEQSGVIPVELKEIVYQAVAYLGWGRVRPFLSALNQYF